MVLGLYPCVLVSAFYMRELPYEMLTKRCPHRQKERVHRNKVAFHNRLNKFFIFFNICSTVMLSTSHCSSSPRHALENLLDQGVIKQTLQLGSSFCILVFFGVDGIMEEHNELTVDLDKVHEITLFMSLDDLCLIVVSSFDMVLVVRPKSVFAMVNEGLLK